MFLCIYAFFFNFSFKGKLRFIGCVNFLIFKKIMFINLWFYVIFSLFVKKKYLFIIVLKVGLILYLLV